MRNNLDREELLTDKIKKQISGEYTTDNRHERHQRKIRKELINDSNHQKCELHIESPEMSSCISLGRVMPILPEKVNLLL